MIAFFATKLGRTILLASTIAAACGVTYWLVSDRAYDRGVADCQAAQRAAQDAANREQAAREDRQRQGASTIAKDSTTKAETATRTVDASTAKTEEVIRYVYRDRPAPPAGACVPGALDERVQDRINRAVDSANATGGSL